MKYTVKKVNDLLLNEFFNNNEFECDSLKVNNYLWKENNYKPDVEVKLYYSNENLLVHFRAFEKYITAKYLNINDPVYKDSCVEFFVNLFPDKSDAYFNFEINAIGTIYAGFGNVKNNTFIDVKDIETIRVFSTIKEPVVGAIQNDNWEIKLIIPIKLFEKFYNLKFMGNNAKANFYKCGDESQFEHYGCWNPIISSFPNFHLPEYFGDLFFE